MRLFLMMIMKSIEPANLKSKNKPLILKIIFGVLFMFGFCYLLVPVYSLVCKREGINGRGAFQDNRRNNLLIDTTRTITVQFTTTIHGNLDFQFRPLIKRLEIHPGETKKVYFYAENNSDKMLTVQAVPSIAPGEAAKYLKKTQCFCFTQQSFLKNERVDMPVIFHVDPEIPKHIHYLTLNYTLFDASNFVKKGPQATEGRIEI